MLVGTRYCRFLFKYSPYKNLKRKFISDAFKCEEAWNNRLKSSLLQKVNLDDMFVEIDNKFNQTKKISAVDVDIFVNAVNSSGHIDEMEDIVHRLRLSSDATNIFPSTHHAFIRAYLNYGNPNDLMRILDDRLNYGIFPDDFCYILLMDYFIKKEDYRNASKVAVLQMLQEEFPNDLLKYKSIYSCCKYLMDPTDWEEVKQEDVQDDGEEVKVRVKYLRNPYFDNHFDLKDPNILLGKTLLMISENIDIGIKKDILLIGYCLLKDWKQTLTFVNNVLKNKYLLSQTAVDIAESICSKETSEEIVKDEFFQDSVNGIKMLKKENIDCNIDLLEHLQSKIKQEISEIEGITEEQIKVYKEWLNNRDTAIREEIENLNKKEKLEAIKKKKQELLEREQELFFFERENDIDLEIEKKKIQDCDSKKSSSKKNDDIEYIPPEITKKRPAL